MFFRKNSLRSFGHSPDYIILGVALFLLFVGFFFLSSASSDVGKIRFDDSYHFLKSQALKGLLPGLAGFAIGFSLYYRRWRKLAPFLLLMNIVLLGLVFSPWGYEANGANRWLNLGPLSFQPSELLKITFVLYLASLFSSVRLRNRHRGWYSYWLFLGVSGLVAGLILAQPATTMAVIVIGAGTLMYLLSGASWKQILLTGGLSVVLVASLALMTPYRLYRIAPFWNTIAAYVAPGLTIKNIEVDRFHLDQSLNAIGTGGTFGVGFGKSTTKYSILPEPMGDSIFSVIAEETGFVGGIIVLASYVLLFWRGTALMRKSQDDFARLTLLGFVGVFSLQAIIHIAANSGVLPFTGVPLPFISYGGTALAVSLTMMGIVGNISRHTSH